MGTPEVKTPKYLLELDDSEVFACLQNVEGLIKDFRGLIEEVYGDDKLAEQRGDLREQMQFLSSSVLGEPDPDCLDDPRLKVLLKTRIAIRKAFYPPSKEKDSATEIALEMLDGDLAFTTFYFGGHGDIPVMLGTADNSDHIEALRFSPELQEHIVGSDIYQFVSHELARNPYLTDEAQMLLFHCEHPNVRGRLMLNPAANSPEMLKAVFELEGDEGSLSRMLLMFSGREFSSEILSLIMENEESKLIWKATAMGDREAEMEIIERASVMDNVTCLELVARKGPLLSEEAVRELYSLAVSSDSEGSLGLVGSGLRANPNIRKYSDLIDDLDIEAYAAKG